MGLMKASLDKTLRLRWLFADLNSYFASCEQQEDPDLRGTANCCGAAHVRIQLVQLLQVMKQNSLA